jgi:hypothetical protein
VIVPSVLGPLVISVKIEGFAGEWIVQLVVRIDCEVSRRSHLLSVSSGRFTSSSSSSRFAWSFITGRVFVIRTEKTGTFFIIRHVLVTESKEKRKEFV